MKNKKQRNECYGCGKCCYNVPLPKYYLTSLKNRIVNEFTSVIDLGGKYVTGVETVFAETKGGICPFLKPNNTCNIYERRPAICRNFGRSEEKLLQCPTLYGKENVKLSEGDIKKIMIESLLKGKDSFDLEKFKKMMR